MKREIPQKIDTALSLHGKLVNQPHPTSVVSTLLRRTRSVSVLGFVITVSAFGGFLTERSANAVVAPAQLKSSASKPLQLPDLIGSSRYKLSAYQAKRTSSHTRVFQTRTDPNTPALVASKPIPASTVLITQHPDLLVVSTSPRPSATQESRSEKSSVVSFTQSDLARTSSLLSSEISLTTKNLLASTDILDLDSSDNILALGTTDILDSVTPQVVEPILVAESAPQYLLDLDALLSQADTASDVTLEASAVANPLDLTTALEIASQPSGSLEFENDVAADAPDPQALEANESIAVLPDIDLSQTIIPNDQNSALIDSGAIVHKVKPGETLEDISRLYQISAKEIKKANRITDPSSIGPKTRLRIPAHQSLSMSLNTAQDIVELDSTALAGKSDVLADQSYQSDKNDSDVIQTSSAKAGKAKTPVAILPSSPQLSPGAGLGKDNTVIATRSVLPQIPSLELPPLSSVDRYLPSQMLPGPQKYLWPAKGVLTSGYGWRWGRPHRGIDIAAPVGTPVVASAPGVVTTAGWNRWGYGNLVEIRHPDGSLTLYAHNHKIKTRVGQSVYQGQQIAEMGSTGLSTGPHTHFELHSAGKGAINPMPFLRKL